MNGSEFSRRTGDLQSQWTFNHGINFFFFYSYMHTMFGSFLSPSMLHLPYPFNHGIKNTNGENTVSSLHDAWKLDIPMPKNKTWFVFLTQFYLKWNNPLKGRYGTKNLLEENMWGSVVTLQWERIFEWLSKAQEHQQQWQIELCQSKMFL
jgi:hypothetical protein